MFKLSLIKLDIKAFTLVEVLVVIAIMSLLSVAAMTYATGAIDRMQFQTTFNKIEDLLYDARSMALKGEKIQDCTDVNGDQNTDDSVVAAGYGLRVYETGARFVVFSDMHNFSKGYFSDNLSECSDIVEKEYTLPEGFSVNLSSPATVNFLYLPPDAIFESTGENGIASDTPDNIITIKSEIYTQSINIGGAGVPSRTEIELIADKP